MHRTVLSKVFLALRTDFIPGFHTEHITLAYFDEISWDKLTKRAAQLDNMLPATIVLKEAMTWESNADNGVYAGYRVSSPDSLILDHLSMPHITVPLASIDSLEVQHDAEVVDRLWVGKKIDGHLTWMRVSNKQIGAQHGT